MTRTATILLSSFAIAGCAAPSGPYPSLQPRVAETIDPRVPVMRPLNDRPASADLVARLSALVAQANSGNAAFGPIAEIARNLAESAGRPQSESWIAAQQALSAAVAARTPTARAIGDIDAIGAELLQRQGGLAPNDLKAIENAAATVGAMDRRQAAIVTEIHARLGA